MDSLKIRIDDRDVECDRGMTILQAAEKSGINIPTLCYHRDLIPTGSCRICVVELDGSGRLIGSCHTPIAEGMVVHTHTSKVLSARSATIELLLAAHTGPCVLDWRAAQCSLHNIASDLEVGAPRFKVKRPRFYAIEDISPYVHRDLSKCILCSRCISACNELAGKRVFGTGYRGFQTKVIVDTDVSLFKHFCKDCYLCVEYCPTSALIKAKQPEDKTRGKKAAQVSVQPQTQNRRCGNLLPLLKQAQKRSRYISERMLVDTAESLNLSVSDVYGVSTFYSFLSTRPLGANVIRVCKSLPCCLQGSEMILKSIEDALGIKAGQTTSDRKFSLELANCIGACDRAPAMLVNQEVHGDLTPRKISRILKQY
jgi:NADH:ubiquinone oxidoreductase subunit E